MEKVTTTITLPKELHSKLELIRAASQVHLGQRMSMNDLMVSLLEAEVQAVQDNNPGVQLLDSIDVSFMWRSEGCK